MTPSADTLSLGAALLAGIAASGHCIGMCGGIAGALAMRSQQAGAGSRIGMGFAYNLKTAARPSAGSSYGKNKEYRALIGTAVFWLVMAAKLALHL